MKSFSNVRYLAMKSLARVGRIVCVRDILSATKNNELRTLWINELWNARLFLTEIKRAMHFVFVLGYSQHNARVWYMIRNAFKNGGFQLRMLNKSSVHSTIRFVPVLGPFLSNLYPRRLLAYCVSEYQSYAHHYDAILRFAKICSLINEVSFGGFFFRGEAYTIESFEHVMDRMVEHKRIDILPLCTHASLVFGCSIQSIVKPCVVYIALSYALLR